MGSRYHGWRVGYVEIPGVLEDWTEETVLALAKSGISEPAAFDFKSGEILRNPSGSARLSQEACAFANSNGGFLIIGVSETPDGWRVEGAEANREINKHLSDRIRVEPPLRYPEPKAIALQSQPGKFCYVVHIPPSDTGPHASVVSGVVQFYERTQAGAVPMTWASIRDRMLGMQERRVKLNLLLHEIEQQMQVARGHLNPRSGPFEVNLEGFELSTLRRLVEDLFPILAKRSPLVEVLSRMMRAMNRVNSHMPAYAAETAQGQSGPKKTERVQHWRVFLHTCCKPIWEEGNTARVLLGQELGSTIAQWDG